MKRSPPARPAAEGFQLPAAPWLALRCFLFAACLLANAVSAEESPETLIKRLADDDPAVRDESEAALLRRGPEVLGALDRFAGTCGWSDLEGSARLANAAARIRDEIRWTEGAKSARKLLEDARCPHGDHDFKAELVPLHSPDLHRAFPTDRLFAARGTCCAGAGGWNLVAVDGEGKAHAVSLSADDPIFARAAQVGTAGEATEFVTALEAALDDPLHFEESVEKHRESTTVLEEDEKAIRINSGLPTMGHEWTFERGRLSAVKQNQW